MAARRKAEIRAGEVAAPRGACIGSAQEAREAGALAQRGNRAASRAVLRPGGRACTPRQLADKKLSRRF